jgi:hypothetical protein
MKLSDFIALTLDEIMAGVTNAAEAHKASGRFGFINPMDGERNDEFASIPISNVSFDVAVTVETSEASKTGGGVNLKVIEASIGSNGQTRLVGESRVAFTVPVCLPTTKLTR